MRREPSGWRNRVTLLSLTLVSLAVALWPVMLGFVPPADWRSAAEIEHQTQWVEAWHPPVFRTLLVALVLCIFGHPRLIAPIAVTCVATALFWLFSTMP
jgi:hypothetical protein